MPPGNTDSAFIEARLKTIIDSLSYSRPAVQDKDGGITATIAPRKDITQNVAYHDYYRLELGTPVIKTIVVDPKVKQNLKKVLDITTIIPHLFGPLVLNAAPTEAEEVEDLVAEINSDLRLLGAGPVPSVVQSFVSNVLSDYLDSAVWSAMSIAQRERMTQLASAWAALTAPPIPDEAGAPAVPPTTTSGGGGPFQDVLDYASGRQGAVPDSIPVLGWL